MDSPPHDLPDDIDALRAVAAAALARNADDAATIARQNLEIARLKRQNYGPRSERTARLIEQMELALEELEAAATEDELAAERAAAKTKMVTINRSVRPLFGFGIMELSLLTPGRSLLPTREIPDNFRARDDVTR